MSDILNDTRPKQAGQTSPGIGDALNVLEGNAPEEDDTDADDSNDDTDLG